MSEKKETLPEDDLKSVVHHDTLEIAMLHVQRSIPVMQKKSKSHHGRYLNLNDIREVLIPICNCNGLIVLQTPRVVLNDRNEPVGAVVNTQIIHVSSGKEFCVATPICGIKDLANPQHFGIGTSYAARYAIKNLFGIQDEEDTDGNMPQIAQRPVAQQQTTPCPAAPTIATSSQIGARR